MNEISELYWDTKERRWAFRVPAEQVERLKALVSKKRVKGVRHQRGTMFVLLRNPAPDTVYEQAKAALNGGAR